MFDRDKAIEYLRTHLSERRVGHSIRVMKMSMELAKIWGVDESKAEIAGLLHDSGKWQSKEDALKKIENFGIILENELVYDYNLVHGILGMYIAQNEFGVYDREVLDAIRYHITGRRNMTMLEKVVYLADKLEQGRDYPRVDEFRELARNDIDKALIAVFGDTVKLLIDRGEFIATDTVEARNWLLLKE
ncbi:hypothetical protein HMPREF1634_04280 [Tissierellia bacterium S7-1-4]|uniref:bis(5'-nucleosyl)-tetraphosphatase (symmetrical) YqeK n=1 Tax=Ezakiella coagulans TaxID=46507 RepID=UPI00050F2AD8|nr:bis(5'-nucleosyl)-tetraphosphatase (symmetrical) YqeK [Ezakiella coagulans]KGF07627.1 hypothetical protein HMPREF1634_04280 [Tissierellia bacterium S7-1-4]UQK61090.1 bis(5'-nucleosyl)-tetraphosphatase (symmetrical) YqeK [Ezakiella coagulans]